MDEVLKAKLIGYLSTLESGAVFLAEEIPIFAQEMINYLFWENVVTAIALFILLIIELVMVRFCYTRFHEANIDNGSNNKALLFLIGCIIFTVVPLPTATDCFYYSQQAIKCAVAPRLVLVEKLSELVR